ncbi:hypothetical protein [Methyloterricola oryzae]|uniref:hypothetical protein n=1 Tax=Methyloterricola oryzae TaxID=1495050 RepID=UPI00069C1320|nr:hypothetical protein [Methyloterricola oryzae]
MLIFFVTCDVGAVTEGCWVDIFDEPEFKGLQARLEGPVDLPTLKGLHSHDWNDVIDSLEVGPHAEVTVYRDENYEVPSVSENHPDAIQNWKTTPDNFRTSIQTFYPNQSIHHFGEFNLHNAISSIRLKCVDRVP